MRSRISIVTIIVFLVIFLISCGKEKYESIVVTAQVAQTLEPESNTATVLIGKTTIENIFLEPDLTDTTFSDDVFPITVEPISGAFVKINALTLSEKADGVYFKAALDLEYMKKYDLYIETEDVTINGTCFLPDSFSIITPHNADTLLFNNITVVWSKSDSAEHYIVGVQPVDTLNEAEGWSDCFEDTSCIVPEGAFEDTLGNFCSGVYSISLMAFNGAWKKGALDLFFSGGNLSGAKGIYGAAVYPPVLVINVKD